MVNFLELSELVRDNAESIRFLQNHGIIHAHRFCRNGHAMKLYVGGHETKWRCNISNCRQSIRIKSGTWLEGCHLDLRDIILFIYCWSQEYNSIKFCKKELNINCNHTIVDYSNFLREVCAAKLLHNPIMIGGPGLHVQIDESLFVRRKYNVGRVAREQWVFGGVCEETKESFLYAVDNRSAASLIPIIQQTIRPGTTIISDLWRAYNVINAIGYNHLTVNHSINFVDPITGANTNRIEGLWNQAKAKNRKRWGTHRSMIDSYMCEFMWRSRFAGVDSFESILRDIAITFPPVQ